MEKIMIDDDPDFEMIASTNAASIAGKESDNEFYLTKSKQIINKASTDG